MYVIVYTVTMTVGALEVNVESYHGLTTPDRNRLKLHLLGKRFGVKCLKKTSCARDRFDTSANPSIKQHLRAVDLKRLVRKRKRWTCSPKKPRNRSVPSEDTSLPQPSLPSPCDTSLQKYEGLVSPGWTPQETQAWLQANRYTAHLQTLASYGGSDLLRLSKENLVQLCGLPDGIRLHNALHARVIPPRLTLYLSLDSERDVYEGVYLKERSRWEMVGEVAKRAGVGRAQVGGLYLEGPGGIRVAVTDSLVAHLPDHSAFSLHVVSHDAASDSYHLLLKRSNVCSSST